MTRREAHFDAMLRHLGATYYQTLRGQGTPQDVEKALSSVEQEAARQKAAQEKAGNRSQRAGRWRVRDVMTPEVIAVDKPTPSPQIARLMSEHHINAVPVLTGSRRVAGVVSEADLLRTQHRPGTRGILRHRRTAGMTPAYTAAQLMSSPPITIHPDAPISAAARRMTDNHLTLLPVVDESGVLMGVISRRDLLKVFLRPDEDIVAEVSRMLSEVLLIDPATVTVSAKGGLVTLKGSLDREDIPPLAVRLTADIDGVLGVVDKLTTPSTAGTRSSG